jgi:hypothetical protein
MELSNGAPVHHPTHRDDPADLTITLIRPQLLALLSGTRTDDVRFDGDPEFNREALQAYVQQAVEK